MKKFIRNILLFFCIFLLLNFLLYPLRKKFYLEGYNKAPINFHSYLLADSHGEVLKQYTQQFGVYNFSYPGDSYEDLERKLNYLLSHSDVDSIFLSADDHMLSSYRGEYNNLDRSVVYSSPKDFPNEFEYIKSRYIEYQLPLLHPRSAILTQHYLLDKLYLLYAPPPRPVIANSFKDYSADLRKKMAIERIMGQFVQDYPSKKLENVLHRMIERCRLKKIVLVGIKFPLSAEYLAELPAISNTAAELMTNAGIEVWDFSNLYPDKTENFENPDHVNPAFAQGLTDTIFAKRFQ